MTARPTPSTLGRLVRPVDFERVLATGVRLRSDHFAIHHVPGRPAPPRYRRAAASAAGCAPDTASLSTELSTEPNPGPAQRVDDSQPATGCWLGLVVPKRHARRAVTRTLLKRQIRQVVAGCWARLEPGLWVVRLRLPFDPRHFPSASSDALKRQTREELHTLLDRAVRGDREASRAPRRPSTKPEPTAGP